MNLKKYGVRRQCEFGVMKEVNDPKKQKKYARVLCCLRIVQAKGILTYRKGRIVYVDKLAQAARVATQDVWDLLDLVTKEPRTDTGRVPKMIFIAGRNMLQN